MWWHRCTNRHYIDVTSLAKHVGNNWCSPLSVKHAFTGWDYMWAFLRKREVQPLQLIGCTLNCITAFDGFGEPSSTVTNTDLEAFVCALYGKQSLKSVSDAHYPILRAKFAPTNKNQPLAKLKGANATFKPCTRAENQKYPLCIFTVEGGRSAVSTYNRPGPLSAWMGM